MPVDGVLADEEPLGNRLIVQASRNQPKNLDLSWRQAFPVVGPGRRRRGLVVRLSSTAWARRSPDWRREVPDLRSRAGPPRRPLWDARALHDPSELRPRATGLKWRAALLEQMTASSRCFSQTRIAQSRRHETAARLADARSGPVRASLAMAWSSATACVASSVRPFARQARTISSSAAARSVRFFTGRRRRWR